jgi:hypothetical protein
MKKVIAEGVLWGGFKGENNLKYPYYILPPKKDALEKDAIFVADMLKTFARKRIRITIEQVTKPRKKKK